MKQRYLIVFEAVAEITKKQYETLKKDNRIGWDSDTPIATVFERPIKIQSARLTTDSTINRIRGDK